MEKDEKVMTGEESLRIITEMINKTKVNIRQSSFHLLFWGWLIFGCSLSEYLLLKITDFTHPYYVWFFVVPGIFISIVYGYIKGRKESVYTYATTLYIWTWLVFLFATIVLFIIVSDMMESFAPLILILAAIPTFISGIIIKFRPLVAGAVTFWIFAFVARFGGSEIAALSVPASVMTGYLIPGYLLKRKIDHDTI